MEGKLFGITTLIIAFAIGLLVMALFISPSCFYDTKGIYPLILCIIGLCVNLYYFIKENNGGK